MLVVCEMSFIKSGLFSFIPVKRTLGLSSAEFRNFHFNCYNFMIFLLVIYTIKIERVQNLNLIDQLVSEILILYFRTTLGVKEVLQS